MKFLKQQNINKFNMRDQTLFSNQYGRTVMSGTGALQLPKGTTAQRPQPTNISGGGASGTVRVPNGDDGYIRYNTSPNPLIPTQPIGIEAYINGVWEIVRAPSGSSIIKDQIGPDTTSGAETLFGPLNSSFSYIYAAAPRGADSIIVLVENVMQISSENFTIVQNPAGVPVASFYGGAGSYPAGYYLQFSSSVPIGKKVTIYYGFVN
jgi:hypothetical protein